METAKQFVSRNEEMICLIHLIMKKELNETATIDAANVWYKTEAKAVGYSWGSCKMCKHNRDCPVVVFTPDYS